MGPWTAENECLIKCMRLQKGWNAWQIMREFPLRNSKKTCWTILLEKFTKPKVRDLDCVKWVRTTSSEQTSQELMNKAIDQWLDSIAFRWSFALKDAFAIRQRYLICVETDLQFVTHTHTHPHPHTHTHTHLHTPVNANVRIITLFYRVRLLLSELFKQRIYECILIEFSNQFWFMPSC